MAEEGNYLTVRAPAVPDDELQALALSIEILKPLPNEAQRRILNYLCYRFPQIKLAKTTDG